MQKKACARMGALSLVMILVATACMEGSIPDDSLDGAVPDEPVIARLDEELLAVPYWTSDELTTGATTDCTDCTEFGAQHYERLADGIQLADDTFILDAGTSSLAVGWLCTMKAWATFHEVEGFAPQDRMWVDFDFSESNCGPLPPNYSQQWVLQTVERSEDGSVAHLTMWRFRDAMTPSDPFPGYRCEGGPAYPIVPCTADDPLDPSCVAQQHRDTGPCDYPRP